MKIRWYQHSTHGVKPMTSPRNRAPKVEMAATSQAAKTTTRAAINTSPEPFSNVAASLFEDGLVVGAVWLATTHPLVFGLVLSLVVVSVEVNLVVVILVPNLVVSLVVILVESLVESLEEN